MFHAFQPPNSVLVRLLGILTIENLPHYAYTKFIFVIEVFCRFFMNCPLHCSNLLPCSPERPHCWSVLLCHGYTICFRSMFSTALHPQSYRSSLFWINILDAVWQALIIFFIPYLFYADSSMTMWRYGVLQTNILVICSLFHAALETRTWVRRYQFVSRHLRFSSFYHGSSYLMSGFGYSGLRRSFRRLNLTHLRAKLA